MRYKFADRFTLTGGIGPMPGTRTMMGSHPLWNRHDRVMADEYFRTGFTFGIWTSGMVTPTIGNNISTLGVNAVEDTRDFAYGASVWWMPTTGDFGPQGGMGDFEYHEELATRFGCSLASSPKEDRTAQPDINSPDSTQIRLGDSLLLFEHDAPGDGITVQTAHFDLLSVDTGLYVQGSFYPIRKYLEVYPKIYDLYAPLWSVLTPEARDKVLKTNYERLFDAARVAVRAWEKADMEARRQAARRTGCARRENRRTGDGEP